MNDPAPDDALRRLAHDVEALVERARAAHPHGPPPCWAHLRLESDGHTRDYLLGRATRLADDAKVLHWTEAPLAGVFFACRTGDDYELDVDGRTLEGVVRARTLLDFAPDGSLCALTTDDGRLERRDGVWTPSPDRDAMVLTVRSEAARLRLASAIEVALDEHQRAAVERPARDAVLVLGEAGVGKTTVALHRLKHLDAQRGEVPLRAAVIVPTEGLRRLTQALVERLGLRDVTVRTYDDWAAKAARRAFQDIPVRESDDTPPGAIRLKRHRALASVLRAYARETRGRARREDLHRLFGDRVWMERVAAASDGGLAARDVEATLRHTSVQYSETTEQSFSHVFDRARLQTVDGRAIDAGTSMGAAGTVDVEDYAVLFELDRLRAGDRAAEPKRFEALVLDEAQELAPLELTLLGRAVAPGGSLIVSGDAGQQVDATACFTDWPTTMRDLGAQKHHLAMLTTSYRCPDDVTALARHILAPARPAPDAHPHVAFARAPGEGHLVARLSTALRELGAVDPRASVAVIARSPEMAARLARLLARGCDVRLALDGDFRFGPGVTVTAVHEVKGLEFDYVVVPDASRDAYGDDEVSRRALYVAVTRAIEQVVLVSVGPWSPLLDAVTRS